MKKKQINKDTIVCISVAQKPSNFGTTLFNAAFDELGVNAIYKACQVKPGNLAGVVAGIRALDIRGCGVSMPFKQEMADYMDSLDSLAKEIGAVNTVVNNKGKLKGYNTDCYGALAVLKEREGLSDKSVVIVGAGGVAHAISCALKKLKVKNVMVVTQSKVEGDVLVKKWGFEKRLPWSARNSVKADLLINATPVGMSPYVQAMPINGTAIKNFNIVMDVVINPLETSLTRNSLAQRKKVIKGHEMSLWQAVKQFELYVSISAPVELMKKSIKEVSN